MDGNSGTQTLPWKDSENCNIKQYGKLQEPTTEQDEKIAKVEPVPIKIWDMQVRASARILEKGVQDGLIAKTAETRRIEGGRDWTERGSQ